MMMKSGNQSTVLVIGGAGYIGSHMCKLLSNEGYDVIVLDNLSTGFKKAVKYGKLIVGDLGNEDILDSIFTEYNIMAVFHFAAFSQVQESVNNPIKYYKNNVSKVITLLDKIIEHKIDKFIFSSTAAVFGNPEYLPIDENHPKNPINPYGKSKLMVEHILHDLYSTNKLSSVQLRYFNAAGADPDGELGENHDPETHLIPIVLEVANKKREKISIYGDDYSTEDGTCVRDYIHIVDLCVAHLQALEYLNSNAGCISFNLGNGNGFSVKEIIDKSREITSKNIDAKVEDRRPGDPDTLISNSEKAQEVLNWKPIFDLNKIIEHAWKWERQKV